MKKTPLKRKTPLNRGPWRRLTEGYGDPNVVHVPNPKPRKRLPRVSRSSQERLRLYVAMMDQHREERCSCQRCGRVFAWEQMDAHHPFGRRAHHLFRVIMLCRGCHDWVHSSPNEASAQGWLQPEYRGKIPNDSVPRPWLKMIEWTPEMLDLIAKSRQDQNVNRQPSTVNAVSTIPRCQAAPCRGFRL